MSTETSAPDAATQLAETWGKQFLTTSALMAPAAKRPRAHQDEAGLNPELPMPKGKGHGHPRKAPRQRQGHRNQSEESELVRMTARLALAHEDSLSMQRADKGFILHFYPGTLNLIPALMALSPKWKTSMSTAQGHVPDFIPLRVTLFRCVVAELLKFKQLREDKEMQRTTILQGAIETVDKDKDKDVDQLKFRMLRWDSSTQTMIVDHHRPTMTCTDTESRLQTLAAEAAESANVIRFHATRPMQNSQSKTVVVLELSCRAVVLHRALLDLCGHPIWSLVSASLKPEAMRRTPLAQALAKKLEGK